MIFQLLLSAGLIFIVLYAFKQKHKSLFVSVVTVISALCGLYFVWAPNQANAIANIIGIGRGADLILYCWVFTSLLLLLILHFKVRSNLELITSLARKLAIAEAEKQNRDCFSGSSKTVIDYTNDVS